MSKPKILYVDIETSPITAWVWGLFDQNIGLNQIKKDWHLLSWAARWDGEDKILYMDQRKARNIEDDKKIVEGLWKLLDEADIVIGHNSKKFDIKKINARIRFHNLPPYSPIRQIDTLQIARKHFAFTSNKLEHLAEFLGCTVKKLKHRRFIGFDLWKACMDKNQEAFKEIEAYNKRDVEVTEEVFEKLIPWDNSINLSVYNGGDHICTCGSKELIKKGIHATNHGIYKRFKCKKCGKPYREKVNELTAQQKKSLKSGVNR